MSHHQHHLSPHGLPHSPPGPLPHQMHPMPPPMQPPTCHVCDAPHEQQLAYVHTHPPHPMHPAHPQHPYQQPHFSHPVATHPHPHLASAAAAHPQTHLFVSAPGDAGAYGGFPMAHMPHLPHTPHFHQPQHHPPRPSPGLAVPRPQYGPGMSVCGEGGPRPGLVQASACGAGVGTGAGVGLGVGMSVGVGVGVGVAAGESTDVSTEWHVHLVKEAETLSQSRADLLAGKSQLCVQCPNGRKHSSLFAVHLLPHWLPAPDGQARPAEPQDQPITSSNIKAAASSGYEPWHEHDPAHSIRLSATLSDWLTGEVYRDAIVFSTHPNGHLFGDKQTSVLTLPILPEIKALMKIRRPCDPRDASEQLPLSKMSTLKITLRAEFTRGSHAWTKEFVSPGVVKLVSRVQDRAQEEQEFNRRRREQLPPAEDPQPLRLMPAHPMPLVIAPPLRPPVHPVPVHLRREAHKHVELFVQAFAANPQMTLEALRGVLGEGSGQDPSWPKRPREEGGPFAHAPPRPNGGNLTYAVTAHEPPLARSRSSGSGSSCQGVCVSAPAEGLAPHRALPVLPEQLLHHQGGVDESFPKARRLSKASMTAAPSPHAAPSPPIAPSPISPAISPISPTPRGFASPPKRARSDPKHTKSDLQHALSHPEHAHSDLQRTHSNPELSFAHPKHTDSDSKHTHSHPHNIHTCSAHTHAEAARLAPSAEPGVQRSAFKGPAEKPKNGRAQHHREAGEGRAGVREAEMSDNQVLALVEDDAPGSALVLEGGDA